MKRLFFTSIAAAIGTATSLACTVCRSQQPKFLKGITHGVGPDSSWDYLIVAISVVIVVAVLFISAWKLIKPGEANSDHIKRSILNMKV